MYGYLTTNVMLSKWSDVSANCTFCNEFEETSIHLLVKCDQVKNIWKALVKWLDHFCAVKLEVSAYVIIFNDYKDSFAGMVNTILLITKYYIYVQWCLNKELNFQAIQKYKFIEEKAARLTGRVKQIKDKWTMYDFI